MRLPTLTMPPTVVRAVTGARSRVFDLADAARSPQEFHELMRDAGLKPGRVHHAGLTMLVEGVAP